MTRSPTFFRDARQQPPKGLDSHGNPLPEAEPRRVNGYLVKPPMRWTKDSNGRVLPLNSAAWRKLRKQVLAEEPLCRHCAAQGLVVPATEVDHINNDASDNRHDPSDRSKSNFQALCKPCHSIKTMAALYGRPARMGCDAEGNPINPAHHWNKSTGEAATGLAGDVEGDAQKSPAADGSEPTCSPSFNADCLKNRQP